MTNFGFGPGFAPAQTHSPPSEAHTSAVRWTTMSLAAAAAVAAHDLAQRRHSILRNFPLIGHGRYLIEKIGPELRQYIITSNNNVHFLLNNSLIAVSSVRIA